MSAAYRLIRPGELDAGLADAWRAAQSGSEAFASPYFCPEFTRLVGEVRDDVRIALIENAGRTVGFFPHQRSLLGAGRPVGGPLSDFHGVVASPGAAWTVEELMRAARLSSWRFDHLVDPAGKFCRYAAARAPSPRLELAKGLPARADFARKARKMARELGELRFTLHEPDAATLEQLVEWKRQQYRRTGAADVFAAAWTARLLRRLMQAQGPGFAGVCSTLRAGGRLVALHAGMRSSRVLHWWFPAYDRELARFSPGIILLFQLAEAAPAAGIDAIDLGKGDEAYKQRFMTGAVELAEGTVERPSLLSWARQLALPQRLLRRIERAQRFR